MSPEQTTTHVLNLLHDHGQSDYIGESISQLAHSLQAASSALAAHASIETIIAALLHDIGQFLPEPVVSSLQEGLTAETMTGNVGRVGHERIGALYLSSLGFSQAVCDLVESHVAAKRYLCAVEPGYEEALSSASRASLKVQGGRMNADEVKQWQESKLGAEMAMLRRWDDGAKVVGLVVPGLDEYRAMIQEHLMRSQETGF